MNWVDLVIILILVFFAWDGTRKSFIGQILDFLFLVIAFLLSLRFYDLPAKFLESQFHLAHSFTTASGFFIVWAIIEVVLSIGLRLMLKQPDFINRWDLKLRRFSFIPAILRGLIFIAIALLIVATFPVQPTVKQAIQDSKLGSVILGEAYQLEAPLKNVFGGITQQSLTFLTVEPQTHESINLGFKTTNYKVRPDLETQMIGLVNQERAKRGIKTLTYDSSLQLIAREHSQDMFERGYFSHYSPEGETVADRADKHQIEYQVIGENLAYAPSLQLAHNGLMNSPGHRANILSTDYNKIGIGIMDGGVYGLMITQVFSN